MVGELVNKNAPARRRGVFLFGKTSAYAGISTTSQWQSMAPIKMQLISQKPKVIAMYLNPRRSNKELTVITGNKPKIANIVP